MVKKDTFRGGRHRGLILFLAIGLLLSSVWGCGGAPRPKSYSRPEANIADLKKVAVLPLDNLTTEELAAEKVRRTVIAELLVRGIAVVEPGEVTRAMRELKIESSAEMKGPELQKLGEMLGVEIVMAGSVGSFAVKQGITAPYPEVSIHLMLLEASSGDIVWSAWHTSGGPSVMTRHFGTEGITLSEALKKVVKEAIDMLF